MTAITRICTWNITMKSSLWLMALAGCAIARSAHAHDIVPGAPQTRPIAIVGGTVHPASGPAIEGATVLFDHGKIVAVGEGVDVPAAAERVDAAGRHVYPGFIDANTQIGLIEIPTVAGSVDEAETGRINPNVRAHVAFNPDSELIPVTRANGVLAVLSTPTGGLISGQSAVMMLDGWSWEDMTLQPSVGLHVQWPRMAPIQTWSLDESAGEQLSSRDRALAELKTALADARAYAITKKAGDAIPFDARWDALVPLFERKLPMVVHADEIQQIQSAVAFARREGLRLVIVGGYDAAECASLLVEFDVPVIVGGVQRLPRRRADAYDAPFTLPARLRDAGVKFCIAGSERTANVRNLPYHAGTAAAHGLTKDEALRAITLSVAEILGVDDRIGSLEAGKDATLFIASGDALETPTQIEAAYIQGRAVDLNNRHTRLYRKYEEKYRRLDANE